MTAIAPYTSEIDLTCCDLLEAEIASGRKEAIFFVPEAQHAVLSKAEAEEHRLRKVARLLYLLNLFDPAEDTPIEFVVVVGGHGYATGTQKAAMAALTTVRDNVG